MMRHLHACAPANKRCGRGCKPRPAESPSARPLSAPRTKGSVSKTVLSNLIGEEYLAANPPNGSGIPDCNPSDWDLVVDSELCFILLLKNIEENGGSAEQGIIRTVSDLIAAGQNTMNFIMTDGHTMWSFRRGHDLCYLNPTCHLSVTKIIYCFYKINTEIFRS